MYVTVPGARVLLYSGEGSRHDAFKLPLALHQQCKITRCCIRFMPICCCSRLSMKWSAGLVRHSSDVPHTVPANCMCMHSHLFVCLSDFLLWFLLVFACQLPRLCVTLVQCIWLRTSRLSGAISCNHKTPQTRLNETADAHVSTYRSLNRFPDRSVVLESPVLLCYKTRSRLVHCTGIHAVASASLFGHVSVGWLASWRAQFLLPLIEVVVRAKRRIHFL